MTPIADFEPQESGDCPELVIVAGLPVFTKGRQLYTGRDVHLCYWDPVVGFSRVSDNALIHDISHFKLTGIEL